MGTAPAVTLPVIAASTGSTDFGRMFLDIAVILLAAKFAAEVVERAGIPAVIGEIVAGIALGPSALGIIAPSDALRLLAEIGVVILLAEVGMEMDIKELSRVGRAALLVAVIGVAVPVTTGFAFGIGLGETSHTSLFLGAALAATSVGITARVFGDLKALSSREARIVLGAAVADDVLGLVLLTVASRVVQQGTVDIGGVLTTIGIAIGFILVAGFVGLVVVPPLFDHVSARVTSTATMGVVAAGITFASSAAASEARLAPIIGAFVAGVALGRTAQRDKLARDFASLGSVFVPIFFLQIGVETDVGSFFDGRVLLIAALLFVIALLGKIVAAAGAAGTGADRLVIGLGMVPRGEVGLIFASIGVGIGVFDADLYASIILVVLATTVVAPPLLKWRIRGNERAAPVR